MTVAVWRVALLSYGAGAFELGMVILDYFVAHSFKEI